MSRRERPYEWASKRCWCMAQTRNEIDRTKKGYTNPQHLRTIGNICSWVCLNCLQAHVCIFDLSEKYPKEIHHETFDCIDDLPPCLQRIYWSQDEDGRPMIDDEEYTIDFDRFIAKRRRQLDLPALDDSGMGRALEALPEDREIATVLAEEL